MASPPLRKVLASRSAYRYRVDGRSCRLPTVDLVRRCGRIKREAGNISQWLGTRTCPPVLELARCLCDQLRHGCQSICQRRACRVQSPRSLQIRHVTQSYARTGPSTRRAVEYYRRSLPRRSHVYYQRSIDDRVQTTRFRVSPPGSLALARFPSPPTTDHGLCCRTPRDAADRNVHRRRGRTLSVLDWRRS